MINDIFKSVLVCLGVFYTFHIYLLIRDWIFESRRDRKEESRRANVECLLMVRKIIHMSREARHNRGNPRYEGEHTWVRRLLDFQRRCFNSRGKKKLLAEYANW